MMKSDKIKMVNAFIIVRNSFIDDFWNYEDKLNVTYIRKLKRMDVGTYLCNALQPFINIKSGEYFNPLEKKRWISDPRRE